MEYNEIKRIIDDVGNSNLTAFEMTFPDGTKISMSKSNSDVTNQNMKSSIENKSIEKQDNDYDISNENSNLKDNYKYITSPMVGTFYLRPAPDKDDFVSVGKHINKGDTTCIIESMKLMNEIESDISGEIFEILKEDGSPVEFGEKLFKVK